MTYLRFFSMVRDAWKTSLSRPEAYPDYISMAMMLHGVICSNAADTKNGSGLTREESK